MRQNGIFVDDGVADDTGNTEMFHYEAHAQPYVSNSPVLTSVFQNIVIWKCRMRGVWMRVTKGEFHESVFVDLAVGTQLIGSYNAVINSLFIINTTNTGNPSTTNERVRGRSMPSPWCSGTGCRAVGFEQYDNGGPQHLLHSTFIGYTTSAIRYAGAVGQLCERNTHTPLNKIRNLTLINSVPLYVHFCPYSSVPGTIKENPRSLAFQDMDGSMTGRPFDWLVGDEPIMHADLPAGLACTNAPASWSAAGQVKICPPFLEGFANIQVTNEDLASTDFGSVYSDLYKARWFSLANPSVWNNATGEDIQQLPVDAYKRNLVPRRAYAFKFFHPTPPKLFVQYHSAGRGDWAILALPYPSSTTFTISSQLGNPMPMAASRNAINSARPWFFDSAAEWLYIYIGEKKHSVVEVQSFAAASSWTWVRIIASCGSSCTASTNQAMAANVVIDEERYQAALQSCQAPGSTSLFTGTALLTYRPSEQWLSWSVYHNLPADVPATGAELVRLPGMTLVRRLGATMPPIRSGASLTWDEHEDLYAGRLAIVIKSAAYPTGELVGRIGCSPGAVCSAPVPRPVTNAPCTIQGSPSLTIYAENALPPSWTSWSWGIVSPNYRYRAVTPVCGNDTLYLGFLPGSAGCLRIHYNPAGGNNITASRAFVQFYIRRVDGNLTDSQLKLELSNATNAGIRTLVLTPVYIDRYAIDRSAWSRVRVPLADLGVTTGQLTKFVEWRLCAGDNTGSAYALDEIRIIDSQGADTLVGSSAAGYQALAQTCACGNGVVESSEQCDASMSGHALSSCCVPGACSLGCPTACSGRGTCCSGQCTCQFAYEPASADCAARTVVSISRTAGDIVDQTSTMHAQGYDLYSYALADTAGDAGAPRTVVIRAAAASTVELLVAASAQPSHESGADISAENEVVAQGITGNMLYVTAYAPPGTAYTLTFDASDAVQQQTSSTGRGAKAPSRGVAQTVGAAVGGAVLLVIIGITVTLIILRMRRRASHHDPASKSAASKPSADSVTSGILSKSSDLEDCKM